MIQRRFARRLTTVGRSCAVAAMMLSLLTISISAAKVTKPEATKISHPAPPPLNLIDWFMKSNAAKPSNAPVELLHDVASKPVSLVNPLGSNAPHVRRVWMEVTAYCPCVKCCGPHAAGITASGHDISYNASRFVAADTAQLPFGTRLIVPGYNNATAVEVIDRGGAIKGNKLDVFFPTHQQALDWGRRRMPVFVVE